MAISVLKYCRVLRKISSSSAPVSGPKLRDLAAFTSGRVLRDWQQSLENNRLNLRYKKGSIHLGILRVCQVTTEWESSLLYSYLIPISYLR